MRHILCFVIFVFAITSFAFSQWNPDTILIWDNDRGLSRQIFPAVGSHGARAFVAWQDSRWGDYDIYRQVLTWGGSLDGKNEPVSIDNYNQYRQIYPDITSNPSNQFITVWEDSVYRPSSGQTRILCRIQSAGLLNIDQGPTSRKQPSIDSRINGEFAITWVHYDYSNWPTIMFGLYDPGGVERRKGKVCEPDSIRQYIPISRVAFCDSGFFVVFDDSSRDGTQRSIYGSYFNTNGVLLNDHVKISWRTGGDNRNERCPDIAVCDDGYGVAVWMDERSGTEIWAQRFIFRSGGISFSGPEIQITDSPTLLETRPRVTVFPTGDFVVVWHDVQAGDYNVWYRAMVNSSLRAMDTISVNCANRQLYPDVHTRYAEAVAMTWMSTALSPYEDVFARTWSLDGNSPTGLTPISSDIKIIPSSPDTGVGGRRVWYFDDENYDNPLTPWNEDPVDEPDSEYVDIEYAMVDQLMEFNNNGQYFVTVSETLPIRQQGINGLGAYEAILLDFGFRTEDACAGVMNKVENDSLFNEINIYGMAAMMEGNDFGSMYDTSTLFSLFRAEFLHDGVPYTTGNIDTLYGVSWFARDETLKYDYQDLADNYVDSIRAINPAVNILKSGNPLDRWSGFRSAGWGSYFYDEYRPQGNVLYHTFPLGSIKSTDHPNTYSEFYRRCMGFLGLNCQPEPITNLAADTVGYGEGELKLSWTIVCDDSLGDPCNSGYTLKFSRSKMTNDAEFNAAEEYYQTWTTPGGYGTVVAQSLFGLPPLDTLVFALKVEDEDGLINALGAEPQMVVPGDSVSPHTITIGSNYVKDFSNKYEMLHAHTNDTLFVTWDANYFYIGYARFTFNGSGDFFVYMDVASGGPDTTYPWNGSSGVSRFYASPNIFYPDYVFIVESSSSYSFYQGTATKDGNRDTWIPIAFHGSFMEDNVVNGYQYTEIAIPFSDLGYNTSNPFKLVVITQNETSNNIIRIYPILNPVGSGQWITHYYYWTHLGSGRVPNQSCQVIGITEEESLIPEQVSSGFEIIPNPSRGQVQFVLSPNINKLSKLAIYDASGRQLIEHTIESSNINIWSWDARDNKGNRLSAGIYFAQLKNGKKSELKKFILLK